MTLLIGGIISGILGLIGFILWFSDFLIILKGGIPLLMIAGGCLAAYIGFDELQEKFSLEKQRQEDAIQKAMEDAEHARMKADQYREELEKLKGTLNTDTPNIS